jgi:CheY-like chemotaxis protein
MRGWDLLKAISPDAEVSTTPVIVMTASGADVEANARKFPNVVKVLIKPFDILDFIRAIETTLGKSGGP